MFQPAVSAQQEEQVDAHHRGSQSPEIVESIRKVLRVLYLNAEVVFMLVISSRKIHSMLIEARLSTDANRRVQVEWQFTIRSQRLSLEKLVQP